MNVYTVYCNDGRYDLNALVQATTKQAARNKVKRALPRVAMFNDVEYKVRRVSIADDEFVREMEIESEVKKLKRGGVDKVVVYDEGT